MSPADLIQIIVASALTGAAFVVAVIILWAIIRDARAQRERRRHYVQGRTILHRI
jgi:hypothetical protein